MKVTKATKTETEADLEARARAALLDALPWLDGKSLNLQVSFTIRFGHAVVHINGKEREHVKGRADILVTIDGRPVFVIELKRPGLGLNDDDVEQGLSYARVLHPRPPLVLVTDSKEVRFVETHTGEEWQPVSKDEEALKALLNSAALVAADDMKRAVSRLLGVDPKAWVEAVRAVSAAFVEERCGGWDTPELPFVEDFLLPRHAVTKTIAAFANGQRLVLIEGDPISGKSSAIRELIQVLGKDDRFAVLALDADAGIDLFSAIADILSAHLFWPVTPHEARHWIQQLSQTEGITLVLAVDNFDGSRGGFRRDLEALTSPLFGERVRVVLAVDTSAAYRLRIASNGRTQSVLMRRNPERLTLAPLDDIEFANARKHLKTHGIAIMDGGERSKEYRLPWVLRTMLSANLAERTPAPGITITIPAIPTLQLLEHAQERHRGDAGPASHYRGVTEALIKDAETRNYSPSLKLQSLDTYLVRRAALREQLGDLEIRELIDAGLLQEGRSDAGESIYYPKLQELIAVELSHLVAESIVKSKDAASLARDLVGFASNVPLGPIIAAQAIFEAAEDLCSLDYALVDALIAMEPKREALAPGMKIAGRMPDETFFEMTGLEDGRLELRVGDRVEVVDADGAETLADIDAWMILSYLATRRMAADTEDGSASGRLDGILMLKIGSFPVPLLKPQGVDDMVETHNLPGGVEALCHNMGICEPITYAMLLFFSREPEHGQAFVEAALERKNVALLLRIDTALRQLSQYDGPSAEAAATLRKEVVLPSIKLLV